jgi:hypothetical protein
VARRASEGERVACGGVCSVLDLHGGSLSYVEANCELSCSVIDSWIPQSCTAK